MKRLFALVGFAYLTMLTIVFYLYSTLLFYITLILTVFIIILLIFLKIQKDTKLSICVFCITILCACFSFIIYSNFIYLPIVNNYDNKTVKVKGYVCDSITVSGKSKVYPLKTYEINGEEQNIRINITSIKNLNISEFDKINCTLKISKTDSNYLKSKRIFLQSNNNDVISIHNTNKKEKSFYYYIVCCRTYIKSTFNTFLTNESSNLCNAVLLGDKSYLSSELRQSFNNTGTSFLIVVSGLHLSIVSGFILFIIRRLTKNKIVTFFAVNISSILFMALTGFAPSVVRATIMIIISYTGILFLRNSDSLNSIGIAGLVITILNPFAVADVGLLLSFTATIGIVLWCPKFSYFIFNKFNISNKFLKAIICYISTSVCACIWILPYSIFVFGKISLVAVPLSVILVPVVSVLIGLLILLIITASIPYVCFISSYICIVINEISKFISWLVLSVSQLSFCYIDTNKLYFYIWMIVTIVLVGIGFFVKNKLLYSKITIGISMIILMSGWIIYTIISLTNPFISIYSAGNGTTAIIKTSNNTVSISCGGDFNKENTVLKKIKNDVDNVNYIVVPDTKRKYERYFTDFNNSFNDINLLVYDNKKHQNNFMSEIENCNFSLIKENSHFTLKISENIFDEIYNINGITYQIIRSPKADLLFIPANGDASKIPPKFLNSEYILTDGFIKNYSLLKCKTLIFSGDEKTFNKYNNMCFSITENVISTIKNDVKISLNNGG